MTRREWAIWSAIALVALVLVWWTEARAHRQCETRYTAAQCIAWLR